MKILLVHNNYGKYSGEEAVVDKMASMFREHGHEVCFYRLTTERSRESLSGVCFIYDIIYLRCSACSASRVFQLPA